MVKRVLADSATINDLRFVIWGRVVDFLSWGGASGGAGGFLIGEISPVTRACWDAEQMGFSNGESRCHRVSLLHSMNEARAENRVPKTLIKGPE